MGTIKQLPLNSQFKLQFAAPLFNEMQVSDLDELISLNVNTSYLHKLVWVISENGFYYLTNGDGSQLWQWTKYTGDFTISQWNNILQYNLGDIVYLDQKIYKVINPVIVGESPDSSNNWLCISGEITSQRFTFTNLSKVTFVTNIPNPIFTVYVGDLELDEDNNPILDNYNYPQIINEEIVSVGVYKRTDIAFASGYTYEFQFFSGETIINQTGIVIVK